MTKSTKIKRNKRDNGAGSIPCQLKDGRWCSSIMVGYSSNGKPKKHNEYGKTSAECKKKMKEFVKSLALNEVNLSPKMKATDFFDHYLQDYKKGKIETSSYDRLISTYENDILPHIKHLQLAQITPSLIKSLLDIANNRGLKKRSIEKIHGLLKTVLKTAVKEHLITENPIDYVPMLGENEILASSKTINIYSNEEIRKIIHTACKYYKNENEKTYIHFPMIIFLICTGLRVSECLALTWDDIKEGEFGLYVQVNKSFTRYVERDENNNRIKQKVKLKSPKTRAGNRCVPLNETAITALKQMKELRELFNLDCEFIFTSRDNKHSSIDRVRNSMKNLLKLANINHSPELHVLRHFFGSALANITDNIKEVSELLGHTDVTFTYNTYVHATKEHKANSINILNKVIK